MTTPHFAALDVYHDETPRSAAMNMAVDEALWESAKVSSLRLYRWDHAALSFGYFGRYADVVSYQSERELVRRWTGGGIVFHGDDLTYSIVIPAHHSSFAGSPMSIYAAVHDSIRNAFVASGKQAELAQEASPKISESCFANPVRADVLVNGNKVAGAAQRRSRGGLLQQGSIQHVDPGDDFAEKFAFFLAANCGRRELDGSLLQRAQEIVKQKYGTPGWLRRR
jgi:lipoate-protein ligase A